MPGRRRSPSDADVAPPRAIPYPGPSAASGCSSLLHVDPPCPARARRSATRPARRFGPWERTGFYSLFRKLTGLASILRDRAGALLQATRAWLKVLQTAILVRLPLRRRSGRARSNPAPRSRARFRLSFGLAPRSPTASAPPRFPLPPALGARP